MRKMERIIRILPAGLMMICLLFGYITPTTGAYSSDAEQSTDNTLTIATLITVTLLDDGFEGTPWDANWDGNGTTGWTTTTDEHSGSYAARAERRNDGYLTTDDLDASPAVSITVSFWFKPYNLGYNQLRVQLYNGSAYDTWYDLRNYPTYQSGSWCYFSEEITDPQYFISNFRLRFDASLNMSAYCNIDDVLITMQRWP